MRKHGEQKGKLYQEQEINFLSVLWSELSQNKQISDVHVCEL